MESKWKETMFTTETLKTYGKLNENNVLSKINNGNILLRISIMKMYDQDEDDHSYMDMGT